MLEMLERERELMWEEGLLKGGGGAFSVNYGRVLRFCWERVFCVL